MVCSSLDSKALNCATWGSHLPIARLKLSISLSTGCNDHAWTTPYTTLFSDTYLEAWGHLFKTIKGAEKALIGTDRQTHRHVGLIFTVGLTTLLCSSISILIFAESDDIQVSILVQNNWKHYKCKPVFPLNIKKQNKHAVLLSFFKVRAIYSME